MHAVLRPLFLFLMGLVFSESASFTHADNWERFRGPNGNGVANDKNIPLKFSGTDGVLWKTPIPGDGNSSPVVWGDRVFLQTASLDGADRSLLCLDANTGKEVWKRSIPGAKVKIRHDSSLASATPTTDGEAVFVPFWNGKDIVMIAYNFKGDKLWERNLGRFVSQHGAGASPIVYKDLLIFSIDKDSHYDTVKKDRLVPDPATLYAFDKKTGKSVWETPREAWRACYSVPFVLDRPGSPPELVVTSTTAITSYDPESGKANWKWTWVFPSDPLRTIASSTYINGVLISSSGDGRGDRFAVGVDLKGQGKDTQPKQMWQNKKHFPYVTCPIAKGDHIFFVNDSGYAGCFHARTGEEVWYQRLGKDVYASPVVIDGKIYAPNDAGDVYVIAADTTFKQLARNNIGERIRATPAVANGRLYLRGQDHLFCIGNK
jgi:outer membrane protein assembly factor BamB